MGNTQYQRAAQEEVGDIEDAVPVEGEVSSDGRESAERDGRDVEAGIPEGDVQDEDDGEVPMAGGGAMGGAGGGGLYPGEVPFMMPLPPSVGHALQRVLNPPSLQKICTTQSLVHVSPSTMAARLEQSSGVLSVEFLVDTMSTAKCQIAVKARSGQPEDGAGEDGWDATPVATHEVEIASGLEQSLSVDLGPLPAALHENLTSTITGPEHDATPEGDEGDQEPHESHPVELCVVIRILADHYSLKSEPVFDGEESTFLVSMTRSGDGVACAVTLQRVMALSGPQSYRAFEVYGMNSDGAQDELDAGDECVICISEPRTTLLLPCRHMCLCSGCAEDFRSQTNKCPICRAAN